MKVRTVAMAAAALLPLGLSTGACGARTGLEHDRDASTISPDARAQDPCAPLFEDCDGSEADCAGAFRRGCDCGGTPPSYLVSDASRLSILDRSLAWIGGYFLVDDAQSHDPDSPGWFHIVDAAGRRRLRTLPGDRLLGHDGTTAYVRAGDELHQVDVATGRDIAPPRRLPLRWVVPLGGGDLAVEMSTRSRQARVGLLRAGLEEPTWSVLDYDTGDVEAAWDGRHVLARGSIGLYVYEPYENRVAGPFALAAEGRVTRFDPGIWPTDAGWLVAWRDTADPTAIGLRALETDGTPRGPVIRHPDPLGDPGNARASRRSDGQVAFLYGRAVPDCVPLPFSLCGEHVLLFVNDEGEPMGPPRRVHHSQYLPDVEGFVWAGYSFAYARQRIEVENDGLIIRRVGVELQRICLERLP